MQIAVERAIETMWDRYEEPLSLDDIANTAILSKFYFSRVFRTITGTSPGRFLSAVRLQQAKNLLLETNLSVTEISFRVGYNSLGTFTSRFTNSVSHSPARYRALARSGPPQSGEPPRDVQRKETPPDSGRRTCTVEGTLAMPHTDEPLRVYVGAFREPIVQGRPAACAVLDGPGTFSLSGVPEGVWYVRATAVALRDAAPPWERRPVFVASSQELCLRRDGMTKVNLTSHPLCPLDLPILLALPELDFWRVPRPRTAPVPVSV